ncbi:sensor domain-containing diguanylate cyclase [Clostridium gasigenes]|uniref:PAS domain S-box-containing protein/diguanylate cyclase (GGDEF) domain-containing protein n=1 Tax=Clostridium gasigenes TaxID=94869 RepID=A0A1H0L6N4_9CLOT|nr:sensor domain-containing diguanylate cyclase [Clostridium gasigenes]SDO63620.1 PAS domain S-box-containing protein/diguanylate cyclase (GGDEF) domain-containing protein [Clostridium gasigenes]
MPKKFKVFFYFIFITFLLTINVYATSFKKNILILTSYHRGYEWNDIIEQGFLSILKNYGEYINIKIEYMDALNNNDENYYDKLLTLYKDKYKNSKFDMVICSDNWAYDFFQKHREELFPSTPLIFTGLNNFESYKSQDKLIENSTGVLESIDIKGNIDLILTMHPNTKNIIIIDDTTITGTELSTDLNKLIYGNYSNVHFQEIKNITLEDTIKKINSNDKNSVVLFTSTSIKTNDGSTLYPVEIIHNLKNKTSIPIYGIWDILLGNGIIGGKISSGFDQGVYAGKIAEKIINGELIKNIPIMNDIGSNYMFDYNELVRFKINKSQLPKNSIIINEPSSMYSITKKQWTILLCSLLSFFTLIIIFLIINIQKLIKTKKKLKESELNLHNNFNFLRTLLDTITTPIFCKDINGKYTDCNYAFEEYVGLSKDQIINKTVYDIHQFELAEVYHKADLELMDRKGNQNYETQLIGINGEKQDVIFNKSSILSNYEAIGIVGVIIDITELKKNEHKLNRLLKFKEVMIEVNQSIIELTNINELFDLILSKCIALMKGAKYGSVLLLKEDINLVIASSIGYDDEKTKDFILPLESSFHYLKTKGKITSTIIIDDVFNLYSSKYVVLGQNDWKIVSCISTPIIINNKLFGMMNIDSDEKDIFNEDDIDIMNYMKYQIENTISTHNLYNEIMYLSKYDKLTNIYNRRSFEEIFDKVLSEALRHNNSFLLVIFDLNGLKLVNDTYGHLQGDEFIKSFVNKLKSSISETDILARYGGDEFIGVFSNTPVDALSEKFEELNKYFIDNPIILEGNKVTYNYSYGIATFLSDAVSYSQLIKIADERMYIYKENLKSKLK